MYILNLLIFAVLFLWQLPQNIVALCMLPFLGKIKHVVTRHYCICFEGSKMRGGISLGNFAFVSSKLSEADICHEVDGHTVQSKLLGPLYLLVIGLPSLCWAMFRDRNKHPNYYAFFTEAWANKCANIEVYKPYPDIEYYKARKKEA